VLLFDQTHSVAWVAAGTLWAAPRFLDR
jgi:hypothetical protein